ncbi:MAG: shikimate dehydrogenase, partial [Thermodesulfobacteriota bacterium]|nr:shikimate dehydrogenase [Thermodesulfobacteriota bacterium]
MIDANTLLYALLGDPVSHSLSPVMHNSAFLHTGYNGVYLAFRVEEIGAAVSGIKALGVKGASVTIPHKVSVMEFLDDLDEKAERIGAVNTIINREGKLIGVNSDCLGAVKALSEKTTIKDKDVVILGAGGAARAIGFGIVSEGGRITILNRSRDNGERLAKDLDAGFRPLLEIKETACQILINATPVGMVP